MGFENFDNRRENAEALLAEGRELFSSLLRDAEALTDTELNERCVEIEENMSKLKKESERDYIFLSGKAIEVYRKIGKQQEAEELIKENQDRFR